MSKHTITFAAVCHIGKVREKNQDNLWCNNVYLDSENNGLVESLAGKVNAVSNPAFCIFDGMGGEQQGEMAAYIAAKGFSENYNNFRKSDKRKASIPDFLNETCLELNSKICTYQKESLLRQMGTTAAILMFEKDAIYACNLGDSRIYRFSESKLTKISVDHIHETSPGKKSPLTQCLGVPESEFTIEPHIAKKLFADKERYILCSDGLSDMVSDDEIQSVLNEGMNVEDTAENLLNKALESGGVDNITIIICETQINRRFFSRVKST